jgi:glycosyltransferase involved in cell wall biosynthesis
VRILFLTSAYPSHEADPRGIFVHRLARGLVQAGAEVVVVTPAQRGVPREFRLDGVRVAQAPYWIPRWQTLSEGIEGIGPRIRARPWRAFLVPPLVIGMGVSGTRRVDGCDVVHAHWLFPAGIVGAVAAARARVPLVVTARGGDVTLASRSRLLRGVSRWVLRRADAAIGVSGAITEALRSFGAEPLRTHQIPSGLEIPPDPGTPGRSVSPDLDWLRNGASPRLLFVGSLSPRKSVETLIEAHRILEGRGVRPSTALVGTGSQEGALRRAARGLENVRFPGAVAPERVPSWMWASDLLILPSLSEGRPNVVGEAMAVGTVVLASDIPGTRELVTDGETGFLFPAGDPVGLADTIQRALSIPPEARDGLLRAANARLRELGLSIDTVVGRHLDLYRTLMARPPRGSPSR